MTTLAVPMASAGAQAPEPPALRHVVQGTVTDVLGNPLHACVHASGTFVNETLSEDTAVMTDAVTGAYRLDLAPGTYRVEVYTPFVFPGPPRAGESAGCPHGEWKSQEYVYQSTSITTSPSGTTRDFALRFTIWANAVGWHDEWYDGVAVRPGESLDVFAEAVSPKLRGTAAAEARVRFGDVDALAADPSAFIELPFFESWPYHGDNYGCIERWWGPEDCPNSTSYPTDATRPDGTYDYTVWVEAKPHGSSDWVEVGRSGGEYSIDRVAPALTRVFTQGGNPPRVGGYDPDTGAGSIWVTAEGTDNVSGVGVVDLTVVDLTDPDADPYVTSLWYEWWIDDPDTFEGNVPVIAGHTYHATFVPTDRAGNVGPSMTLEFTPEAPPCDARCQLNRLLPL